MEEQKITPYLYFVCFKGATYHYFSGISILFLTF
jgi:hypothetical protein